MSYRVRHWSIFFVVATLPLLGAVNGQEPGDNGPQPNEQATAGVKEKEDRLDEQTIYIPYEKLRKVFEKEGRGVFLPYEKFQELWNAARAAQRPEVPPKRPVDAVIHEIDSMATIGDQVVNVTARLQIEVLGTGWVSIPLRLRDTAIRSAKIGDAAARIVFDPEAGYKFLYQKQGTEPEQLELVLEYARAFSKTPGQSSVSFEAPQAPINQWRIRVPEAGMAVQVEPLIAATRTPVEPGGDPAGQTDLLAFVGAAPAVKISWNPKAEGATGLAAFATVQTEQQITVTEGVARTTVKLDYEISRSTLNQLVIEIPADQKVVNVFDRNVKRWNVETADDKQVIKVDLFEATQGKQTLLLELEQFHESQESAYEVPAALVRAVGVGRQQGIVVARVEEGLQAEATRRTGLLQLDQNDLPEGLRAGNWGFAYRYGAVPYELTLRVEKVLPRISVTELVNVELAADKLTLVWQGLYSVEEAGLFQLRVDLPPDFEVRSVEGKAIGDSQPAAVDSYHRLSEGSPTWLVNLSQKAFGKVGLILRVERQLSDPNLLSPTGSASTLPIPLPRATPADVEFAQGSLILSAPESLRVNPVKSDGLRSISFAEAYQKIPAAEPAGGQLQPVLAYAFAKGETALEIAAERRKPQVTVQQLLRAEIESGVVKYRISLFYDVKYSGVKSLRIDVPATSAADIRNTSKSLRKEDMAPQPGDVAENYVAWSFAAETELLGATEVELSWEQKIDELGIGKSQKIVIPRVIPMGVDRATGQIVISKSESIDIQPTGTPSGLIPIDPQNDVMPAGKSDKAAMAFEFVGDWALEITATRYELETSKLTSVERGVVRIVSLSQGELSIQALYRLRSARQRLAIQLPEGTNFDAQPLRINGKVVTPERDSATTISAPLADQDIDQAFVLELRYSVEGTPARLDLPSFPDDPAVQKVFLCAYLPTKAALLASAGPWSDEQQRDAFPNLLISPPSDDQDLVKWVQDRVKWVTMGIPAAFASAQTFPIGKSQLHVYSTLRPEAAPNGSLRLTTVDRRMFNGLMIVVLAAIGLPLYRRSLRWQLILLLLITAALILIGVFVPELARTIFGSVFLVALAVLVIIWAIGHISKARLRLASRPTSPTLAAGEQSASPFAAEGAEANAGAEAKKADDEESSGGAPPGQEEDTSPESGSAHEEGGRHDA